MTEPVQPESKLLEVAERVIQPLVKADRARKMQVRVLAGVVIALILLIGFGVWNVHRTSELIHEVQAGSVTTCEHGNIARTTNKDSWDSFINLLITNPNTAKTRATLEADVAALNLTPAQQQGLDDIIIANWTNSPADLALAHSFEAYIAAHESPTNCAQAYDN